MMTTTTSEITAENRTLFNIADDLCAYYDTVEMLEAEESRDEVAISECKAAIVRISRELAGKTDRIAGVLRRLEAESKFCKEQEDRLHQRRKSIERADDFLRKYTLSVMREKGIPYLRSSSDTISIRQTEATDISDAARVPAQYKRVTVTLPLVVWNEISAGIGISPASTEVMKTAVKAAIKAGQEVPGAALVKNECISLR